jgi:hypothetical protein
MDTFDERFCVFTDGACFWTFLFNIAGREKFKKITAANI